MLLPVGVISHHTSIFTNEFSTKEWCSYVGVTTIRQSICLNNLSSNESFSLGQLYTEGKCKWERLCYYSLALHAVWGSTEFQIGHGLSKPDCHFLHALDPQYMALRRSQSNGGAGQSNQYLSIPCLCNDVVWWETSVRSFS